MVALLIVTAKSDWAWVGGSQEMDLGPSFQQLNVESPNNSPGGIGASAYFANGSFVYVFGGVQADGYSKDVLRFNTENQRWSSLSASTSNSTVFGLRGVYSAFVQPTPKSDSVLFLDIPQNSLFVFGGFSFPTVDNSLFEFSLDSFMWRWIHGSNETNNLGSFGVLGVESSANIPPARAQPAYFYDQLTRKAYIYGGSVPRANLQYNSLARADHWLYSVPNNTWTWIHGVQHTDATGVYGETGVGTL